MSWLGLPSVFEDIRPKAYRPPSAPTYSKKGKRIKKAKATWIAQARKEWAVAKKAKAKRSATKLSRTSYPKKKPLNDFKLDRVSVKEKRTLPFEAKNQGWY